MEEVPKDRIIISNIPPCTSYSDLFKLFKSVTQIKRLQYFRLQGKAVLTLHDASSSDFIQQNIWSVCGEKLHLKQSVMCSKVINIKQRKVEAICPKQSLMSEYQIFKRQRDPFWSDIPHENSHIARKKKRIKQRFSLFKIKTTKTSKLTTRKSCKITKAKKIPKKQTPSRNGRDWESLDLFTSCNQLPGAQKAEVDKFHLHVKGRGFFSLQFPKTPSLQTLKNAISDKTNVPAKLHILTHKGKLLKPCNMKRLNSYDTVHLLVRGFGGMENGNTEQPQSKITHISEDSSEESVKNWMVDSVHVPGRFVRQNSYLDDLDGKTLFQYKTPKELKEEANIPLGYAKKTFYFRDVSAKEQLHGLDRMSLEEITPENIEQFVTESLKKDKNSSLAKAMKEEQMDGFSVMLYSTHTEFAKDFDIKLVTARRLLESVQEKIKQKVNSLRSDHGDKTIKKTLTGDETTKETPAEEVRNTTDSFLQRIGINKAEAAPSDEIPQGQIVAIHSALPFGSGNVLAKTFLFWVVCTNEELHFKTFKKNMWDYIYGNLDEFIASLPDDDKFKCSVRPGKSDKRKTYIHKSGNLSLAKVGAKIAKVHDLNPKCREWYNHHVLIVSDEMAENVDNKKYFYIDMNKGQCYQMNTTKYWKYNQKVPTSPSANSKSNSLSNISYQTPREFKAKGDNIVYFRNYIMDRPESGDGMMIPSAEFKYFASSSNTNDENSSLKKFLKETMRFACGCLNRRRNGTIYFGIADDKPVDGKTFKHGEIVGFPLWEIDSASKSKYIDKLDDAKATWFDSPEANNAAKECIRSPVFIKVVKPPNELPHFVMEVDIEPTYVFCRGIKFKLMLPTDITGIKSAPALYVRDGAASRQESDERYFISELAKYDDKRKFEEDSLTKTHSLDPSHKYLAEKLCRLLCRGKHGFDQSLWPVLICGKPTDSTRSYIYNTIKFVSSISWLAVFDFDDEGFTNGLCKYYFSSPVTTIASGDYFRDIESINHLRDNLRLPEQNVYIFSNGRKDQCQHHLQRSEWRKEYSPGMKSAIYFFQHRSVIPPGRALVVFLLLSSDFDGFLDTFGETVTYFGLDQIVFICPDREVFRCFHQTVTLQGIADAEELETCCVVGMTWEQVNDSINRLLGVEEPSRTYLPTSSGAFIMVEPKVEESVDCLSILSATECEHKKLEPGQERKEFIHSKELKFYQGNRVEWWNFFFPGQILERPCFHQLRKRVEDALNGHGHYKNRFNNVYLIHEPGSGGSTLARHILWEFRKSHRCIIVKKMTEKTASDILKIWQYKEEDYAYVKPVLVLVDSIAQHDMDIGDLHRSLNRLIHEHSLSPVCVFLICRRELHDPSSLKKSDVINCELLFQKLNGQEVEWCKNKFLELETTGRDLGLGSFRGEYFISFMIFREGFNMEFLRNTIESLIRNIDPADAAFKLLTYVALLIAFVIPPRGGAATAVPVECCSELMGLNSFIKTEQQNSTWWEYNLDEALKILLLIETKEHGGFGKQIRMAHSNLAQVVIDCVKGKTEDKNCLDHSPLAETVMSFLDSKLLHNSSHAQHHIETLTVELLIRRKKDEYDEEESNFSPLIESIINEDDQSHTSAAAVMEKGYHILKNEFIAQQLARLYLHHDILDKAKHWASLAADSRQNTASIQHTLGRVFKQTFLQMKCWNGKKPLQPNDDCVKKALDEAFEALRIFHKANACEDMSIASCIDIISTVNSIARFLYEKVDLGGKENTYRYLTDADFEPDSIQKIWGDYSKNMKSLYTSGMNAVRQIDEHVYQRKRIPLGWSNVGREDRKSRIVKYKLPDLFQDFTGFFGVQDMERPPSYLTSHPMIDAWHRRCVLTLGCSRLTDILNILEKQRKKEFTVDEAVTKLWQSLNHLKEIWDKTYDDYLNIISIQVVLAQLTAQKQKYKKGKLLEFCKEIISSVKKGRVLNYAYMYAIILMWPQPDMGNVEYNHGLMKRAIKHLNDNPTTKIPQKHKPDKEFCQKESVRYISRNLFYASKGNGLASICCHCDIFSKSSHKVEDDKKKRQLWKNRSVRDKLQFFHGFTKLRPNSKSVTVILDAREYGIAEQIELKNFRCEQPQMTEKPVSFYVGFSLSGPTVCYIKPRNTDEPLYNEPPNLQTEVKRDYTHLQEEELRELINNIAVVKSAGEPLTEKEKKLLSDEEHIKEALLKYEDDF